METTPSTETQSKAGFITRFVRWLFSWRTVRRGLIALVGLITFVALLITEENWRGKHDWERYKSEWEAKGERFDMAGVAPPPVPDDQNFFMAPIWAGVLNKQWDPKTEDWKLRDTNIVDRLRMQRDANLLGVESPNGGGSWEKGRITDLKPWQDYYRQAALQTNLFPVPPQPRAPAEDVLLALSKSDSAIEELRQASRRPYARFPINYDAGFDAVAASLDHFAELKRCAQMLQLRTIAELQLGRTEDALADTKLMLGLTDALRTEPFLISHLVRVALASITLQPIWEGLAQHKWSDSQLAELGEVLAKEDFLADYQFAMRGERACGNEAMARYRVGHFSTGSDNAQDLPRWLMPGGFFYQNQIVVDRLYQQFSLPAVDAAARRVHVEMCTTNALNAALGARTPYTIFARLLFPAFQKAALRFARIQTSADMASVACALERYRLAHGDYPGALDALAPKFIDKVPHDIINGQPLHYRRTDDPPPQGSGTAGGRFVIYSVGWNEKDDGGTVVVKKSGTPDIEQGDWVWQIPK
jgi:hypothetical protein